MNEPTPESEDSNVLEGGNKRNTSMDASQNLENRSVKSGNTYRGGKKKKKGKKLKRYESNSIDEEEFQDYFINPVKRKEFDLRRKRQQVREIHNVSVFASFYQCLYRSLSSHWVTLGFKTKRH